MLPPTLAAVSAIVTVQPSRPTTAAKTVFLKPKPRLGHSVMYSEFLALAVFFDRGGALQSVHNFRHSQESKVLPVSRTLLLMPG